ncbi:MAG: MATE family efflux transporter [Alphaproteobacteria bacterium]|nr:MATE family efflux transporter [Alphaproteobacteria bacterium]
MDHSPARWRRRIGRLAFPLILSNITVPLVGVVDTAVVGHLDSAIYVGAVAVGALIFDAAYWTFGFLRMGTGGLAAQAYGARDGDELRATFARALLLGLGIGVLLIAAIRPLAAPLVDLVGASPEVARLVVVYVGIRVLSAPAALANYALLGLLLGVQRTRGVLAQMVATNLVNILLSIVFVVGLGWDVAGVAAAAVIAEYVGAGVGGLFVARGLAAVPGRLRRRALLDPAPLRRMVALNRDILIRTVSLMGGFTLFTVLSARLGDTTLAANAVLMNLFALMGYALEGFANATEALVGQAVGRRSRREFDAVVGASITWTAVVGVGSALGFALFGGLLVDLMTDLPDVRAEARIYLVFIVLASLIGVWAFLLDGIFIGATEGPAMRNAMLGSFLVFALAAFPLVRAFSNVGLWSALTIFMLARGIGLGLYYPRLAARVG